MSEKLLLDIHLFRRLDDLWLAGMPLRQRLPFRPLHQLMTTFHVLNFCDTLRLSKVRWLCTAAVQCLINFDLSWFLCGGGCNAVFEAWWGEKLWPGSSEKWNKRASSEEAQAHNYRLPLMTFLRVSVVRCAGRLASKRLCLQCWPLEGGNRFRYFIAVACLCLPKSVPSSMYVSLFAPNGPFESPALNLSIFCWQRGGWNAEQDIRNSPEGKHPPDVLIKSFHARDFPHTKSPLIALPSSTDKPKIVTSSISRQPSQASEYKDFRNLFSFHFVFATRRLFAVRRISLCLTLSQLISGQLMRSALFA